MDIDAVNKHGKVPFELALTSPGPLNLHILSELIPSQMDLIQCMNERENGSLSILKMLLKKDMRSVDVKEFSEFFHRLMNVGCRVSQSGLLCDGIHNFKFKYEMIQVLVENGIPITVQDIKEAVEMRRLDVAHLLLTRIMNDPILKEELETKYPDILIQVIGPFEWGAFDDDLAIEPLTLVKLLLERFSIDVNHTNHRDKFILHNLIREYPRDTIAILDYLLHNYPHLDLNKKIFIRTGFQPPWSDSESKEEYASKDSDSDHSASHHSDDHEKKEGDDNDNEKKEGDGEEKKENDDEKKEDDEKKKEVETSKDHDKEEDGNNLGVKKEDDENTLGAKREDDGNKSSTSIDVGSNQERMESIKLPLAVVSSSLIPNSGLNPGASSSEVSSGKVSSSEVSNGKVSSSEVSSAKVSSSEVPKAGTSKEGRKSPLLEKIPILYVNEEGDKASNVRPLSRRYLRTALELALENGRYEFAAILIRNFASVDALKVPAPSMVGFTECYQLLHQLRVPLDLENSFTVTRDEERA